MGGGNEPVARPSGELRSDLGANLGVFKMTRRVLLSSWCILLMLATSVEARKWTDVAGNQINAEYVRIHEGEVILRQGNRILKCPYDRFCELDKAYIRQQMEAESEKENRRLGVSQVGGPVASEKSDDDEDYELRTWRDMQGNKILAQYAGFTAGRVELIKEGKRVSYRYEAFSPVDQQYVADILVTEGRGSEIPQQKQQGAEGSMGGASSGEGGSEESDSGAQSSAPYEVTSVPVESAEPPGMGASDRANRGGGPASFSPPISPPVPPPALPSMTPSIPSGPSYQMVYYCSHCKKQLPGTVKAGDCCPECGAYFSYKEGENGTKTYAGVFSWKNHRLLVRLGGLGLFILVSLAGVLARRSS